LKAITGFTLLGEGTPVSMSVPGFRAPVGIVSAIRHLGWWLDWHTRVRPSDASRSIGD
jgi:hypothetical protein